jgi:hypothetical protein
MSTNDNKKDILLSTLLAADAVVTSVAGAKLFKKLATKAATNGLDLKKVSKAGAGVGMGICSGILLASDFIPSLAQVIDRNFMQKEQPVEEEVEEVVEETVEEVVEEAAEEIVPEVVEEVEVPVEEPVVETVAPVTEEAAGEDEDEDESFGFSTAGLDFFDAMENPERYEELQGQEKEGLIQIVTRYRRSFMSRLVQSQGDVQAYYGEIKNKLLSYKGVKGRVSWGNESFNKGRAQVAKFAAKSKTLYVYLAIDPKTLEDASYEVVDVSDKKKYAAVPALIKVRGDRKFKFVMDLIRQICENDLALPAVADFAPEDYHVAYRKTDDLVAEGLVRKFVAAIPAERA